VEVYKVGNLAMMRTMHAVDAHTGIGIFSRPIVNFLLAPHINVGQKSGLAALVFQCPQHYIYKKNQKQSIRAVRHVIRSPFSTNLHLEYLTIGPTK
jgi:hypothetical protein